MMRMHLLRATLVVLALAPATLALPAAGQGAAPSPEALALAREMVAKTGGDRDATLQSMSAPMVGFMRQLGIQDPARAQVLVAEVVMPIITAHYDDLVTRESAAYAQTLSLADLKAIIAFYNTPAGQDLIAAGPGLAQAKITAVTQWMGALQPEMMTRMQEVMKAHGWDKG